VVHAYLTIAVGEDPERTEPVLVSDDPRVLRAAFEALGTRIGLDRDAPVDAAPDE
jgi:hypothetical protein